MSSVCQDQYHAQQHDRERHERGGAWRHRTNLPAEAMEFLAQHALPAKLFELLLAADVKVELVNGYLLPGPDCVIPDRGAPRVRQSAGCYSVMVIGPTTATVSSA